MHGAIMVGIETLLNDDPLLNGALLLLATLLVYILLTSL
jgi:riboflavin biosynthesis pyrimidine reductase